MRRLSRSVDVNAPSSFALAFLSTFFLERGQQAPGAEVSLRFPVPRFIIDGLTIEKRVAVQMNYETSGDGGHRLKLVWQPLGRGPVPSFDGSLTAWPHTDTTSRLVLDGAYDPPGGVAGALFDALVGVHIAGATIETLLAQLRAAIDADYGVRSRM